MRCPAVDVRRAADRFRTDLPLLASRYSFSFGRHYDPNNTGFAQLLANNEELVQPGGGFETHTHRDMEIVTWVLRGQLAHHDSEGHRGVVHPGLAQRLSAGSGVQHSERNAAVAGGEPVHFVQMWVRPADAGGRPGYEQTQVSEVALRAGLVPVASGRPGLAGDAAVRITATGATLWAARLEARRSAVLPEDPFVHLFVPLGSLDLEGSGDIGPGDAARIAGGGQRVTAGPSGAEILVWGMDQVHR